MIEEQSQRGYRELRLNLYHQHNIPLLLYTTIELDIKIDMDTLLIK